MKLRLADKNQTIIDRAKYLKRTSLENIRQKKLNTNVVVNLQKEVDGNEKQLLEERKKI